MMIVAVMMSNLRIPVSVPDYLGRVRFAPLRERQGSVGIPACVRATRGCTATDVAAENADVALAASQRSQRK
jgi:hypothetical protein